MRRITNVVLLLLTLVIITLLLKLKIASLEQVVITPESDNLVIILSNRVPKCGSYLTRTIIDRLSLKTHAYGSEISENHYECRMSVEKQVELRNELIKKAQNAHHHRFVYNRHFHFAHFSSEPKISFYYINQLRDPIDQLVSGYYYNRYVCMITSPNKQCMFYPPYIYNLTLDDCISKGDPTRCLSKSYGAPEYLIFFCGQSSVCTDDAKNKSDRAALSLAKKHIEEHFLFVGLLEHIKDSFALLEHLQPSMFTGLLRTYEERKSDTRITSTPEQYRHRPTNETRKMLRNLLANEYELYEFVKERFMRQYFDVFKRLPGEIR